MDNVRTRATRQRVTNVALLGAAVALSSLVALPLASASGAGSTSLKSSAIKGYGGALTTSSSKSLYLLSSEEGSKLKCVGSCLSTWRPLLVKDSVTKVTLGKGVKGKIGFVARGASMKQVTYNSFPLYTFVGDKKSLQHGGEGAKLNAGTWFLVKADAASPSTSAIKTTTSTTKPPTTTTTNPPTTTSTAPPTTTTTKPPTTTTTRPPTTTTTRPPTTTTTSGGSGIGY